jgi:hypothetical protein
MTLEDYRIYFSGEMSAEKAESVVELWREVARAKTGRDDIELAASFQRHYTKFGTGLPPNFCVALAPDEAFFFKFDPRNSAHPLDVKPNQLKKQVLSVSRDALRVRDVSPGRLAIGVTFEVEDRVLECRTPRLAVNPTAATLIAALGGRLPSL